MRKYITILGGILVLFGLYLSSLYSFLLFHSLVELFSIVVAGGIFIITWNSRRFFGNNYLLLIGIDYLFATGAYADRDTSTMPAVVAESQTVWQALNSKVDISRYTSQGQVSEI